MISTSPSTTLMAVLVVDAGHPFSALTIVFSGKARKIEKVDDPKRHVVTGDGRLRFHELLSHTRSHHHASSAQPYPDGSIQRRRKQRRKHRLLQAPRRITW
jgi:hypothetical protein